MSYFYVKDLIDGVAVERPLAHSRESWQLPSKWPQDERPIRYLTSCTFSREEEYTGLPLFQVEYFLPYNSGQLISTDFFSFQESAELVSVEDTGVRIQVEATPICNMNGTLDADGVACGYAYHSRFMDRDLTPKNHLCSETVYDTFAFVRKLGEKRVAQIVEATDDAFNFLLKTSSIDLRAMINAAGGLNERITAPDESRWQVVVVQDYSTLVRS